MHAISEAVSDTETEDEKTIEERAALKRMVSKKMEDEKKKNLAEMYKKQGMLEYIAVVAGKTFYVIGS